MIILVSVFIPRANELAAAVFKVLFLQPFIEDRLDLFQEFRLVRLMIEDKLHEECDDSDVASRVDEFYPVEVHIRAW